VTLERSSGPSLTGGSVVHSAQAVLRPPPTPTRHQPTSRPTPVIGPVAPTTPLRRVVGPGRASPVPAVTIRTFHALYAEEFIGAAIPGSSPLPWPSPNGTGLGSPLITLTTRQASLNAADRSVAHPRRMLDAALRPRAFPREAGSLLPGLLAATRTGPTPAGDDELVVESRRSNHRPPTVWAHSRRS
jgi:hypothetical protein